MARLQDTFTKEIIEKLCDELKLTNVMQVPRLSKIVVNMGVKEALSDKKRLEQSRTMLAQITGQWPKVSKAKKSIAAFKVRTGDEIALTVTLRGKRMYDFFEKVVRVVLPRLRDFHGVSTTSFDTKGNYTLGFGENTVFPEIDPGKIDKVQGLEVTFVTTAGRKEEGKVLLTALGMPFRKSE